MPGKPRRLEPAIPKGLPTCAVVLGVDPGTHKCGVSLVRYPLRGRPDVLACYTIRTSSGRSCYERLRQLADGLEALALQAQEEVSRIDGAADPSAAARPELLVAFEEPYTRTGAHESLPGLEHLWMVVGMIPTLPQLRHAPLTPLSPSSVGAVFGLGIRMRREEKKVAAQDWARTVWGVQLAEGDNDAADALAVAIGAGDRWRRNTLAAVQTCLPLKGGRK